MAGRQKEDCCSEQTYGLFLTQFICEQIFFFSFIAFFSIPFYFQFSLVSVLVIIFFFGFVAKKRKNVLTFVRRFGEHMCGSAKCVSADIYRRMKIKFICSKWKRWGKPDACIRQNRKRLRIIIDINAKSRLHVKKDE